MSKIKISICLGSSCFSRGNNESKDIVMDYVRRNNLDAEIDARGCLCTGNCNEGPIVTINGEIYKNVRPNTIVDILNHIAQEAN